MVFRTAFASSLTPSNPGFFYSVPLHCCCSRVRSDRSNQDIFVVGQFGVVDALLAVFVAVAAGLELDKRLVWLDLDN